MFKKADRVNLNSPQFRENAFEAFTRLRKEGTLVPVRMPMIGSFWMTTTYEAANDLLRDHKRFVRNPANAGRRFYTWLQFACHE